MGIGGGIFLIALGAILAFAIHGNLSWLNVHVVGWVLILAGLAVLMLTLYFWQERRRLRQPTVVEQARLVHDPGPVQPDPPDLGLPPGPP
jgi:membrane protein implicated in regulation of membrane protease activity